MMRSISFALLGFALALPLSASAGTPVDAKPEQAVTVAATNHPFEPTARSAQPEEPKTETKHESSKVRGARVADPGLRFHNPYAFPVQAMPVTFPVVNTFGY